MVTMLCMGRKLRDSNNFRLTFTDEKVVSVCLYVQMCLAVNVFNDTSLWFCNIVPNKHVYHHLHYLLFLYFKLLGCVFNHEFWNLS